MMTHNITHASVRRKHEAGEPITNSDVTLLLEAIERVIGERDVHRKRAWTAEKRAETAERRLSSSGAAVNARGAILNDAPARSVSQLTAVAAIESENQELRSRVRDLERELRVRVGVVETERTAQAWRERNPGRERL